MDDEAYDEGLQFELEIAMIEILLGHIGRQHPFEPRLAPLRRLLRRPGISTAARLQHSGFWNHPLDDNAMKPGGRPVGPVELITAVLHGRCGRRAAAADR